MSGSVLLLVMLLNGSSVFMQERTLPFPENRSLGWLAFRDEGESDNALLFGGFGPDDGFAKAQGHVSVPEWAEVVLQLDANEWLDLSPLKQLDPDSLYRVIISNDLGVNYDRARAQQRSPVGDGGQYIGHLTGLQSLALNEDQLTGAELGFLGNMSSLRTLALVSSKLETAGLRFVGEVTSLKGLRLYSEQGFTADGIRQLGNLKQLDYLFIEGVYEAGMFEEMGKLTQLRQLRVHSFAKVPEGMSALGNLQNLTNLYHSLREGRAEDLAFIPTLAKLESVSVRYIRKDDKKVATIAKATQVKSLCLMDIEPGASLKPLASMSGVESLTLVRSRLSDEMLADLRTMKNLKEIALAPDMFCGLDVTDETLEMLGQMPLLEVVDLPFGRYTDEGVKHLLPLKNLRKLNFTNNHGFTDEAIKTMVQMQTLEELDLRAKQFSVEALQELYKLPNLKALTLRFPSAEQKAFMEAFNAERKIEG